MAGVWVGGVAGARTGGCVPPELQDPGELEGEGGQRLVLGVEAVEHLHLPLAVPARLGYPLGRVRVKDACSSRVRAFSSLQSATAFIFSD